MSLRLSSVVTFVFVGGLVVVAFSNRLGWLGPVVGSVCMFKLFLFVWQMQRTWRTFHPYQFERVEATQVGRKTRDFWNSASADFEQLGFRWIGDFCLERGLGRNETRFYFSRDGAVLGAAVDKEGTRSVCCTSLLTDGTYVETAPVERLPVWETCAWPLVVVCAGEAPVTEIYQQHCDAVARLAIERGGALALEERHVADLCTYGRALIHEHVFPGTVPDEQTGLPQSLAQLVTGAALATA